MIITINLLMVTQAKTVPSNLIPQQAPLNPKFIKYQEDITNGIIHPLFSTDGHSLGYIPAPLDLSHLKGQKIFQNLAMPLLSFPSTFDLRTYGKVSPVKDQGLCGSCWAFASYGSLESNELTSDTVIFSEQHLNVTNGFDNGCCNGGDQLMSIAYMSRWSGPVYESDDNYDQTNCSAPSVLSPRRHIREVDWIPERSNPLDNDNIKQALMNYGALYCCFYYDETGYSYNTGTKAYYYHTSTTTNHCVTVVGWDDNYSSTNFVTPPPGNGAFLMKNSWGTNWGNNGYFYMSYYDCNVGEFTLFRKADDTTNYDYIYQYDPLGWTESCGYESTAGWFANIFTAANNEEIAAVSFYVASPLSTYTVAVYLDPDSGPINTTGSVFTNFSTIANPGYQTIQITPPVSVNSSHRFSIVVMLNTPGYDFPIPDEYPVQNYSSGATATTGQSYISPDGIEWSDITQYFPNTNVCLKAFTNKPTIYTIYGYVLDSSGNPLHGSYAYVADHSSGLQIINIGNPTVPTLTGSYNTPGSAQGVAVCGNYAYVADGTTGLQIININNPALPTLAGSYATTGCYANGVAVCGNYAYVVDYYFGLQIINISNPALPTLVSTCGTLGNPYGVAVSGNYAYVADCYSGLQIVNITNPAAPTLAGQCDTPELALGITVSGHYAYVADYSAGVQIIDTSNPASPTLVNSCDTTNYPRSVVVNGNYLYVADEDNNPGLQIIDISNPTLPTQAGYCATSSYAYGVAVNGNYAYMADYFSGLQIIDISNPSSPIQIGACSTPGEATGIAVVVSTVTTKANLCLTGCTSGSIYTDSNGYYQFTNLPPGENCTVTPTESNYTFSPPFRNYNPLNSCQKNQNFIGTSSLPGVTDWMFYELEPDNPPYPQQKK